MSLCEHAAGELYRILELVSGPYELRWNNVVRFPVYPGWKANLQNNEDLHILFVWGGEGVYHMHDGVDIPLLPGTMVFIGSNVEHYASVEPGPTPAHRRAALSPVR